MRNEWKQPSGAIPQWTAQLESQFLSLAEICKSIKTIPQMYYFQI